MCPAILPTPDVQAAANYPPALAAQLKALFDCGDAVLAFPVDFTKADAAVLYTVPTGLRLQIGRAFWEPLVSFAGGAASAIGLSSSNASYNTKGDLLGGAAGDVAAGLTFAAPFFKGTIGAKQASQGVIVLIAGDTIRFDRITSVFTSGSGFAHVPVQLLPTS